MSAPLFSRSFLSIIVANLLLAVCFYALMPTLPLYLQETKGFTHGQLGVVVAAFSFSALVMRPFAGYLLDNNPRLWVYLPAVLLLCIGYGLYVFAAGFFSLLALRLYHGAVFGTASSSTATLVADIVPRERMGQGIGLYSLTMPLGMTLGPFLGIGLLRWGGATTMFLLIMALSSVSFALALLVRVPPRPASARRPFSLRGLIYARAIPASILMAVLALPYGAVMTFASVYAAERNFGNVDHFFLVLALAIIASRLATGRVFDRGGVRTLVVSCIVLAAAGLATIGLCNSEGMFMASSLLLGLGYGLAMPTAQAMVNRMASPRRRGAANSTYFLFFDVGIGSGSMLAGIISQQISLSFVYQAGALVALVMGGAAAWWALRHHAGQVAQADA